MTLHSSQMIYSDYYWQFRYLPKDPHTCGEFATTVFTRTEGPQMVYFLQKYADMRKWQHSLDSRLQKLEYLIRKMVPDNLDSQQEVQLWLDANIGRLWRKIILVVPDAPSR